MKWYFIILYLKKMLTKNFIPFLDQPAYVLAFDSVKIIFTRKNLRVSVIENQKNVPQPQIAIEEEERIPCSIPEHGSTLRTDI